ncbi:bifunctional heptose 7-phosphate kinase/heptose 1-phosphate adenyltransferase [Thermosediminibacter litoriperuensis]|uniref:RfaE bifunctional protein kinase chain/domain n=1 Tax=Thermosediminibacter litoriperuensis TaxID=291989 RepID=A0A5S5AFB4_9FIRM|nr:PfkB family carbohydrate kinase [Thermosediminibacter litoriperuensis]TYP48723.1 rfaE bifunctional protein kinase chain/domain [Thermosediminibacter litoriperuensis]
MDAYREIEKVELTLSEIQDILERIKRVKVGVVGDGCLDIYWHADMTLSRLSRETPHYPLPVVEERLSLGAAANVAANLKRIGAGFITLLTMVSSDWRGGEFIRLIKELGIDDRNIIVSEKRITPAYCKPLRKGISDVVYEDPRIDFENLSPLAGQEEERVLERLDRLASQVDIIAVCDQFRFGVITERVRNRINEMGSGGKLMVVDSRDNAHLYRNVIIKPNDYECVKAVKKLSSAVDARMDIFQSAETLCRITKKPVIVTLGERGSIWVEDGIIKMAPSRPESPPIDIVGAGDTFLSAFCCAYGAGIPGEKSIGFANLASAVVVKKLGTTGTAGPEEIIAKSKELNL